MRYREGDMMKLSDLAFACHVYRGMTDYDASYVQLREQTNDHPDLSDEQHRTALLNWLNDWGCRQFAIDYHEHASTQLQQWYSAFSGRLPGLTADLWTLGNDEIIRACEAFEDLSHRIASWRWRDRQRIVKLEVQVGPTGAAKVLFALRPRAFPPCDTPIRNALGLGTGGRSYGRYLDRVQADILDVATQCEAHGLALSSLPALLNRPNSTLPKLIDEYYWVTITKRCVLPDRELLEQWLIWA